MIRRIQSDLKTHRFWSTFFAHVFKCVGFVAVFFGLYDVIEPNAISKIKIPVSLLILGIATTYSIVRSWPSSIEQSYSQPNTKVRLVVGDLFDQRENLVIGMSDTFDTAIPHIINSKSIQGQFLARTYNNDISALDQDLSIALKDIHPTGHIDKPGKQDIYPIGTVATIRSKRQHYFCVAYSSMDKSNQAQATISGLWISLLNLWDQIRKHANGDPVVMPVIGGGQSRISQILPIQDSLRFIALSFILASRKQKVCDQLDIILRPIDIEGIDMLEFQRFLISLNPKP